MQVLWEISASDRTRVIEEFGKYKLGKCRRSKAEVLTSMLEKFDGKKVE